MITHYSSVSQRSSHLTRLLLKTRDVVQWSGMKNCTWSWNTFFKNWRTL